MKEVASRLAEERPALGRLANELKHLHRSSASTRAASALDRHGRRPARSTSRCPAGRPSSATPPADGAPRARSRRSSPGRATRSSTAPRPKTTSTTSKRSTCRRITRRATCRTRCTCASRLRARCGRSVPRRGEPCAATRRRGAAGHAAAHAHLGDADPLHGVAPAAGAHHRARPRLPPRQPGSDAHADVPAGRRPRRRRGRDDGRPEGDDHRLPARAVRTRDAGDVPPELLPLHRAERRRVHRLPAVRRRRLRDLQAHRLDRGPRLRHGAPRRVRGRRLRPARGHRASPSASASSGSRC